MRFIVWVAAVLAGCGGTDGGLGGADLPGPDTAADTIGDTGAETASDAVEDSVFADSPVSEIKDDLGFSDSHIGDSSDDLGISDSAASDSSGDVGFSDSDARDSSGDLAEGDSTIGDSENDDGGGDSYIGDSADAHSETEDANGNSPGEVFDGSGDAGDAPDAEVADDTDVSEVTPEPPFVYATSCDVKQDVLTTESVVAVDAFPELTAFASPLQVLNAKDGSGRLFVVERAGRVVAVSPPTTPGGPRVRSTFLDVRPKVYSTFECGFLGAAFHPDFADNGRIFVTYCVRESGKTYSLITRLERDPADPSRVLPASEVELLRVEQPYDNHNGGWMGFGPDGYLYYGFGDGGSGNDPNNHGQTTTTLLGKILRLDVDREVDGKRYAIPPGNPFADGVGGRPEICAVGLRNPWRASFDRLTGALWVGDVGQNAWEEVDLVECGKNYGWKVMEGKHCRPGGPANCDTTGLTLPVFEYGHSGPGLTGSSITGGFVYRGTRAPSLWGRYVFADYGGGWVASWAPGEAAPTQLTMASGIVGFGEDEAGELYLTSISSGRVLRLEERPAVAATPPARLSQTGCFDVATMAPAEGVLRYELNLPFWSDGADKTRFLVLPDGGKLAVAGGDVTTPGGPEAASTRTWDVPAGSLLIKHFERPDPLGGEPIRIETRFLVVEPTRVRGFSYRWRADGSDADLVVDGAEVELPLSEAEVFNWQIPSAGQCKTCHRADDVRGGRGVLGLETRQLNRRIDVVHDGVNQSVNQVERWRRWGLLDGALAPADELPAFPAPGLAADDEEAARAWLDANCAFCHQPGGPSGTGMDLRYDLDTEFIGACGVRPQRGDLVDEGLVDALVLAPGEPERSVLVHRIGTRGPYAMPPLGSALVDLDGVEAVTRWVEGLVCEP